jgi:hypothetical protein
MPIYTVPSIFRLASKRTGIINLQSRRKAMSAPTETGQIRPTPNRTSDQGLLHHYPEDFPLPEKGFDHLDMLSSILHRAKGITHLIGEDTQDNERGSAFSAVYGMIDQSCKIVEQMLTISTQISNEPVIERMRTGQEQRNEAEKLLRKAMDNLDTRILELKFFNIAIPAIFHDGLPSEEYIDGLYFSLYNLVGLFEQTEKEISKAQKLLVIPETIEQEIKTNKAPSQ